MFAERPSRGQFWASAGFRNHLCKKYSATRLKERFGLVNVDYLNPPLYQIWRA